MGKSWLLFAGGDEVLAHELGEELGASVILLEPGVEARLDGDGDGFVLSTEGMSAQARILDSVLAKLSVAPTLLVVGGGVAGARSRSSSTLELPEQVFSEALPVQPRDDESLQIPLEVDASQGDQLVLNLSGRGDVPMVEVGANDLLEFRTKEGDYYAVLASEYDPEVLLKQHRGAVRKWSVQIGKSVELLRELRELFGEGLATEIRRLLGKRLVRKKSNLRHLFALAENGLAWRNRREAIAMDGRPKVGKRGNSGRLLQVGLHGKVAAINCQACGSPYDVSSDCKNHNAGSLPEGRDALLLLHGTGKPAELGFLRLLGQGKGTPESWRREWKELHARYPGGVYAYQHRQWSWSPAENAAHLCECLEALGLHERQFDVISHSRGGLVGEVLCVEEVDQKSAIFKTLGAQDRTAFADAVGRLSVRRFVRVAAPIGGSSLIHREDGYFGELIEGLAKAVKGALPKGVQALIFLLKRIWRLRHDALAAPGLAAQAPGSPLVNLLQNGGLKSAAELFVLAGRVEKGLVRHLFPGPSDGVVDTRFMWGGVQRPPGKARLLLCEGVGHKEYFGEAGKTGPRVGARVAVLAAVRGKPVSAALIQDTSELLGGFHHPGHGKEAALDWGQYLKGLSAPRLLNGRYLGSVPAGRRGTILLLPGIMGTHLGKDGDRIWIGAGAVASGRVEEMELNTPMEVQSAVAAPYQAFVRRARSRYRVLQVPFDWRLSPGHESTQTALRESLKWALERKDGPVHMVCHSMGGLVATSFLGGEDNGELLEEMWALGGRVLQLGTPNLGAHALWRMLATGEHGVLGALNWIARMHNKRDPSRVADLRRVLREMPGLLEMLPVRRESDKLVRPGWVDASAWTQFRLQPTGVHPETLALEAAWVAIKSRIEGAPLAELVDAGKLIYVGGLGEESTPAACRTGKFLGTRRGDGTVPWGSADVLEHWVIPIGHERLLDHPASFPGLFDLLQSGQTNRAVPWSPKTRGSVGLEQQVLLPMPPIPQRRDIAPTEALLLALSGSSMTQAPARSLQFSVTHGDIRHARFCPVVGHYEGDLTLNGPASQVDRRLDGRLQAQVDKASFPGRLGTHLLVRGPKGCTQALIVGLGVPGDLTPKDLERTLAGAFVAYVMGQSDESITAGGLSCLLVGGSNGLPPAVLVRAVARAAIRAGEELVDQPIAWLRELEIIEIYEDRALAAHLSMQALGRSPQRSRGRLIRLESSKVLRLAPGRRGLRVLSKQRIAPPHRVHIRGGGELDGVLTFRVSTRLARVEVQEKQVQWDEVNERIKELRQSALQRGPQALISLTSAALPRTLQGLMDLELPLLLGLDARAAQIPWELLRKSSEGPPPVARFPVLRQFETRKHRVERQYVRKDSVLVLGDLEKDHPLRFARQEAIDVHDAFGGAGWSARRILGEDQVEPGEIRDSLRGHRVVHIAAHGVLVRRKNTDEQLFSVLGLSNPDGADRGFVQRIEGVSGQAVPVKHLSAADFEQLDRLPEVVFLNTCHSGRTQALPTWHDGRFAPVLAQSLFELGVKVVVVTGWAIGDSAASVFARSFYQHLLDGETLADAVLDARHATWLAYPELDTYGAYQVYGDPGYRLTTAGTRTHEPGSVQELLFQLEERLGGLSAAHNGSLLELPEDPLIALVRQSSTWYHDSRVCGQVGQLFHAAWQLARARHQQGVREGYRRMPEIERLALHGAAWFQRAMGMENSGEVKWLESLFRLWLDFLQVLPPGLARVLMHDRIHPRDKDAVGVETWLRIEDDDLAAEFLSSVWGLKKRIDFLNKALGQTGKRHELMGFSERDAAAFLGVPIRKDAVLKFTRSYAAYRKHRHPRSWAPLAQIVGLMLPVAIGSQEAPNWGKNAEVLDLLPVKLRALVQGPPASQSGKKQPPAWGPLLKGATRELQTALRLAHDAWGPTTALRLLDGSELLYEALSGQGDEHILDRFLELAERRETELRRFQPGPAQVLRERSAVAAAERMLVLARPFAEDAIRCAGRMLLGGKEEGWPGAPLNGAREQAYRDFLAGFQRNEVTLVFGETPNREEVANTLTKRWGGKDWAPNVSQTDSRILVVKCCKMPQVKMLLSNDPGVQNVQLAFRGDIGQRPEDNRWGWLHGLLQKVEPSSDGVPAAWRPALEGWLPENYRNDPLFFCHRLVRYLEVGEGVAQDGPEVFTKALELAGELVPTAE